MILGHERDPHMKKDHGSEAAILNVVTGRTSELNRHPFEVWRSESSAAHVKMQESAGVMLWSASQNQHQ